MEIRKRSPILWLGIMLVATFLSGCGESKSYKAWTDNGLAVEKDGQVVYCVVDRFDKGFYNLDELTGMAVEEVALFNGQNRTGESVPATVEEVALIEGTENLVRVVYRFDGANSYEAFQGEKLYYGTVEEAVQERLIFEGEVLLKGEESIVLDEKNRTKFASNHVIVTDAKTVIRPPFDVLWHSEGVLFLEDGSVNSGACEGLVILLLQK